jgi:hypothetical protein
LSFLNRAPQTGPFLVKDTGIGISPGDEGKIFEEFIQVESPVQKRVKGIGLGLPLSRKLAQLLGGDIAVTSKVGEGSTFSVVLPANYTKHDATAEEQFEKQKPGFTPLESVTDILRDLTQGGGTTPLGRKIDELQKFTDAEKVLINDQ